MSKSCYPRTRSRPLEPSIFFSLPEKPNSEGELREDCRGNREKGRILGISSDRCVLPVLYQNFP
ncbi:hypothetical protein AKJ61_02405 [candidate division MSBL1 archaeon SCGC-AAA259B11]|uniref:Uncharacterized protein n=1 Tax=candidate division MSBL1 archaeon SCGC-AAA259B11 TaxID=1698260 RepID=A0A133U651_9EURY|nr:hypothetical protein AKJ61_02405 [candidate division MSBL1 archaeon SCGC-AAA259B11]